MGLVIVQRLHLAVLGQLCVDIERPRYDRAALRAGIVHLGVGAFQRAHLAVITEAALHATNDLRWGTVGVSLRQPDTRDALKPQGGLYTVAIRDAADDGSPREALQVVGNLLDVLVAPEDPAAVVERIAHADTRIVSLTVTEKGYCHDPATHYEIQDPLAGALADAMAQAEQGCAGIADAQAAERRRVEVFARRAGLFGELQEQPRFIEAVARHTQALRERGVRATLEACR